LPPGVTGIILVACRASGRADMPRKKTRARRVEASPPPFKTRGEIDRYFSGKTIKCLLCGCGFRRLGTHLATKHNVSVDEYRSRFGLPWTRGLVSADSVANSGWTEARKARARRIARKTRFFLLAHTVPRRNPAPFLRIEAIKHLGIAPLSKAFEVRMRALFERGLSDSAIARALKVHASTVNQRTKNWRNAEIAVR
jgi:hypothetical protein